MTQCVPSADQGHVRMHSDHCSYTLPSNVEPFYGCIRLINHDHTYTRSKQMCDHVVAIQACNKQDFQAFFETDMPETSTDLMDCAMNIDTCQSVNSENTEASKPKVSLEFMDCDMTSDTTQPSLCDQSSMSKQKIASERPRQLGAEGSKSDKQSCNIKLDPKKIKLVNRIVNHLHEVKPKAVCSICGRILYMRSVNWLMNLPEEEWLAKKLVPENSPVDILTRVTARGTMVSVCATCKDKVQAQPHTVYNFFSDYGKRPDCISKLKSYTQFRKMSIGNLYCSTFKNRGYSYLHLRGKVNIQKNSVENMRGMVGVFQDGESSELPMINNEVKPCILWLRRNNSLYKDFLLNLETIHGYAQTSSAAGLFCGLPKKTQDLTVMNDGQLPASVIEKRNGLIIPAAAFNTPKEPCSLDNVVIGQAVSRTEKSMEAPEVQKITYGDPDLEAKLFPHLFPYGKGSWYHLPKDTPGLTMEFYHKHRLLHVDRRWANNRLYPFFAFDRNMKARLNHINAALASNKNRQLQAPLNSATLSDRTLYFMYGDVVNSTITGSKAYWEKQFLDLVAHVSKFGIGDIFFTLTFMKGS